MVNKLLLGMAVFIFTFALALGTPTIFTGLSADVTELLRVGFFILAFIGILYGAFGE